eukprot:2757587-Rhodomonas_salina.1
MKKHVIIVYPNRSVRFRGVASACVLQDRVNFRGERYDGEVLDEYAGDEELHIDYETLYKPCCKRLARHKTFARQVRTVAQPVSSIDGSEYVGQWKDGLREGRGTQVWNETGDTYTGEWRKDRRHGKGKLVCGNGRVYRGGDGVFLTSHALGDALVERRQRTWQRGARGGSNPDRPDRGSVNLRGHDEDGERGRVGSESRNPRGAIRCRNEMSELTSGIPLPGMGQRNVV